MQITLNQLLKYIDRLSKRLNDSEEIIITNNKLTITPLTNIDEYNDFINRNILDTNTQKENITNFIIKFYTFMKLKSIVQDANHKVGLDKLMIELSILSKKINILNRFIINNKHLVENKELLPLDYYKSMFTDESRSTTINLYSINIDYIKELEQQIKLLERDKDKLSDEIALLNQTTLVEVSEDLLNDI